MTLDDHLSIFHGAQADLFAFLGVSTRGVSSAGVHPAGTNFEHGSGNLDIPTPYPLVLDYRGRQWRAARRGGRQPGDDEVLVRANEAQDWHPDNLVRFNIMSYWTPAFDPTLTVAAVTHLPRVDELHYAQPDKIPFVEGGGDAYGDVCILILKGEV